MGEASVPEAAWAHEKKDLHLETAELVADLDTVDAEKGAAVTELTARIAALETHGPGRRRFTGPGGSMS